MTDSQATSDYAGCRALLARRLAEPAPSRIQMLVGPRQVGKTTLLLELAAQLGDAAVYAAADAPDAALPGFWQRLWTDAHRRATAGRAVLLVDEIQHLADWSARLKGQWDLVRRRRLPLHVVISGSSALLAGGGSRESLAGRFERIVLAHWSARSLAAAFPLSPADAARTVVRIGGYPGAFPLRDDPARWRAYVRDAIIDPAIGRDILATRTVRRPALLRQLFAFATTMPASIVSLQKLQGQLQDRGALETLAQYLALLAEAFMVVGLERFSARAHRRRAAPPKLVTLDNALLSAMHPAGPPDAGVEPARFGRWVENACLAFAVNQAQQVTYWREEPLEVDAILDGSWGRWAVEVSTGSVDAAHLRGLGEFTRRHPAYQPLVVANAEQHAAIRMLGFRAVSWEQFLVDGPASNSR